MLLINFACFHVFIFLSDLTTSHDRLGICLLVSLLWHGCPHLSSNLIPDCSVMLTVVEKNAGGEIRRPGLWTGTSRALFPLNCKFPRCICASLSCLYFFLALFLFIAESGSCTGTRTGASGKQWKERNKLKPLNCANSALEAFSICVLVPEHWEHSTRMGSPI